MKNNKLLMIMLIIIVTITLFGGILFVVITQLNKDTGNEAPTIDEILEMSVDVPEITTNLADKRYVKIQFKITTNSVEAGEELAKRDFQVKNIILQELSEMTQADLEGKAGKQALQQTLKSQINELMQKGEIHQVYITSYIIN